MKVALIYPPFTKGGRHPLLSQNRIFSFTTSEGIKIYPYVWAQAATLLKEKGYDVLYSDGINERLGWKEFMAQLEDFNPDLCALETKAPIIKEHWEFINNLKKKKNWKFVLLGDHVSFFPEESFKKCELDFVLTGGDFDFSLLGLAEHLSKGADLPAGTYYKDDGEIKNTGKFELNPDLDSLPLIDRDLTKWNIYGEAYLQRPVAYIMTTRGCGIPGGIGRCTFCIWQYALWGVTARLRSPENVVKEIKMLVDKYKVREIFDDAESGGIWNKEWLKSFHQEMKKENLIGRVILSSNARADCLDKETCQILRKTGFRMLKVGLEAGANKSLEILKKDETIEQIIEGTKNAKDAGLRVMLTTMVGYPWEKEEDVRQTHEVTRELMLYKTHCGDALEANVIIPYPGTPLYYKCKQNNWFIRDPENYENYGISEAIVRSPIDDNKWCNRIWKVHYHPKFILRSLFTARSIHDIKLLLRGVKSLMGHVRDWARVWRREKQSKR